jgi:hypothetical protein
LLDKEEFRWIKYLTVNNIEHVYNKTKTS